MTATATVVVPTRDRPASLRRCLDALRAQTTSVSIVVVDDGSEREADVLSLAATVGARVVRSDVPVGPAAARNSGARAAATEIVLFTDDDCVPAPDWAERLVAALVAGADVVRGTTRPARSGALLAANELIVDHLARLTPFASTSNLGCRRELLLELPFDESFPAAAGEDREWTLRVRRLGHELRHAPGALVAHDPELTLGTFWSRHVRYGRAARRLVTRGELEKARSRDPAFYVTLVARGFRHGPLTGAAVLLAQLATVVGYVGGRETG